MPVTRFLKAKELSKILNYSEDEIDDLVLKKQIPHHIKEGKVLFPMEEVLAKFTPRKKAPPKKIKPKQKSEPKKVIEPKESAIPEEAAEDEGF